jgi:hypothetical protein
MIGASGLMVAETVHATVPFMVRPRWHDALIVAGIVGLLAMGVWALWWDDVRGLLKLGPERGPAVAVPAETGKT